jgi:hypothetical protein
VPATTHRVLVRRTATPREVEAALALRRAVFCDEQGVPLADELDGRDGEATHLVALDGATVVGTCRLLSEQGATVRLGRLAVAAEARRRGILVYPPQDSGGAVGYWTIIRDPDGHQVEFTFGQPLKGLS